MFLAPNRTALFRTYFDKTCTHICRKKLVHACNFRACFMGVSEVLEQTRPHGQLFTQHPSYACSQLRCVHVVSYEPWCIVQETTFFSNRLAVTANSSMRCARCAVFNTSTFVYFSSTFAMFVYFVLRFTQVSNRLSICAYCTYRSIRYRYTGLINYRSYLKLQSTNI